MRMGGAPAVAVLFSGVGQAARSCTAETGMHPSNFVDDAQQSEHRREISLRYHLNAEHRQREAVLAL
ncbi:hypothetical protein D3C78_1943400 [compost metagenome]